MIRRCQECILSTSRYKYARIETNIRNSNSARVRVSIAVAGRSNKYLYNVNRGRSKYFSGSEKIVRSKSGGEERRTFKTRDRIVLYTTEPEYNNISRVPNRPGRNRVHDQWRARRYTLAGTLRRILSRLTTYEYRTAVQ